MKHGYRFQIGWVRATEGEPAKRIHLGWAIALPLLAVIAVILYVIPLRSAPAPVAPVAPAAHVQPVPAPTVTQPVTNVQLAGGISSGAVCIIPTGKAVNKRTIELVKVP